MCIYFIIYKNNICGTPTHPSTSSTLAKSVHLYHHLPPHLPYNFEGGLIYQVTSFHVSISVGISLKKKKGIIRLTHIVLISPKINNNLLNITKIHLVFTLPKHFLNSLPFPLRKNQLSNMNFVALGHILTKAPEKTDFSESGQERLARTSRRPMVIS